MGHPRKWPFSHERQGLTPEALAERGASVGVVHRVENRVNRRDLRDENLEGLYGLRRRGWMTVYQIGNVDPDREGHKS